jgi:hypothetical protein
MIRATFQEAECKARNICTKRAVLEQESAFLGREIGQY